MKPARRKTETLPDPLVDLDAQHVRGMSDQDDDGMAYLYIGDGEAAVALQHDPQHAAAAAEALFALADAIRAHAVRIRPARPIGPGQAPPWLHGPLTGPPGWPGL